ncbi:MAG: ROK family protein [Bacteroidales bacterium]|nr:ROK family protein [Bacteroidales bacterium]
MTYTTDHFEKSIIGVFLDGKLLMTGKVKNGEIISSNVRKIDRYQSEEVILSDLINAVADVFDNDVVGIGIGVPSLVDVSRGIVYKVQRIPSWREVHLKDILESQFGVKVYVNNDANCFAVGEMYFGKAKNYENVVGLIIGQGVGAGIIFKGHLYSGTNCGAGEFGSIPYRENDFEYYCSESYFDEKYGLSFDVLYERAKKKDKIALAIFEQYGLDLGNVLKSVMYTIDPEIVVIGGSISQAFCFFEKSMWEKVNTFTYKHTLKKLKIVQTDKTDIAILGAASLYYDAQNRSMKK